MVLKERAALPVSVSPPDRDQTFFFAIPMTVYSCYVLGLFCKQEYMSVSDFCMF